MDKRKLEINKKNKYSGAINKILSDIENRNIEIVPLLKCDKEFFELARVEAISITHNFQDKSDWNIPEMTFNQYNLFNSEEDLNAGLEDLDVWRPNKRFNSKLKHIPKLINHYFEGCKLQNCRLLTVNHSGALGMHTEPILGITNNEDQYKLRFHIPFSTSHETKFYMNDKYYLLENGYLYFYNQYCRHGVDNKLGFKRAHLVFDIFLDEDIITNYLIPYYEELKLV